MNTLSLFSGGGGLDLGFSAAGYNILCSSDVDEYSCSTLQANQNKTGYFTSHPVLCDDIKNISAAKFRELSNNNSIDFVIGGPPCQAFSIFGKRKGLQDPRGNLVFEYARIIDELNPKGFLFENVAGLKTIHGGQLFEKLIEKLSFGGRYKVSAHEYQVADFGVPQFRQRIFIVGCQGEDKIPPMDTNHTSPNTIFNGHMPYKTVGIALSDMPKPITDWRGKPEIDSHVGRKHSQRIIDRYASLKFRERDPNTRINKLDPQRPSYTIIVGSDKGGGKGHVHPFFPREVTPRESARLQTFPDWWEFCGRGRHVIRQVGNAVPPLFAAQLADYLAEKIFDSKSTDTYNSFVKKLKLHFLEE